MLHTGIPAQQGSEVTEPCVTGAASRFPRLHRRMAAYEQEWTRFYFRELLRRFIKGPANWSQEFKTMCLIDQPERRAKWLFTSSLKRRWVVLAAGVMPHPLVRRFFFSPAGWSLPAGHCGSWQHWGGRAAVGPHGGSQFWSHWLAGVSKHCSCCSSVIKLGTEECVSYFFGLYMQIFPDGQMCVREKRCRCNL